MPQILFLGHSLAFISVPVAKGESELSFMVKLRLVTADSLPSTAEEKGH